MVWRKLRANKLEGEKKIENGTMQSDIKKYENYLL